MSAFEKISSLGAGGTYIPIEMTCKNCAKRHIRPLYVNFGGDIFLFCVWFRVWHSSVQPLYISFISIDVDDIFDQSEAEKM